PAFAREATGRCRRRTSKMGNKPDDQQIRRPRSFTMIGADLEAYFGRRATQDASVQAGESPAAAETTQEEQLAGGPSDRQAVPDVVPRDTKVQSAGQVMGEQLSKSQDEDSDDEKLIIGDDVGEEMMESGDVKELDVVPRETTQGHPLAQMPQDSEIADNEKNARLEAQMEDSL
ncbi:UNVERIFIED_CONTAM: hypothetical protein K2H54_016116, partial [Gekko kuhli]